MPNQRRQWLPLPRAYCHHWKRQNLRVCTRTTRVAAQTRALKEVGVARTKPQEAGWFKSTSLWTNKLTTVLQSMLSAKLTASGKAQHIPAGCRSLTQTCRPHHTPRPAPEAWSQRAIKHGYPSHLSSTRIIRLTCALLDTLCITSPIPTNLSIHLSIHGWL
jgi:hypothetical protein